MAIVVVDNFHSIRNTGQMIGSGDTLYITPVPQVERVSIQVRPITPGTCSVYVTTVAPADMATEIGGGSEGDHWVLWDEGTVNSSRLDFLEMTPTAIKIKSHSGNWKAHVRSA